MLKMRFGSFVWPNNPRTYTLSCKRQTAVHKIPMGGFAVQDLGRTATVMQGEGEFFGAGAYDTFQELLSVFQKGGQQMLVHPVWQTASAYFTELTLTQEPRDDYVAYRFTFCEAPVRRVPARQMTAFRRQSASGSARSARDRRFGKSARRTDSVCRRFCGSIRRSQSRTASLPERGYGCNDRNGNELHRQADAAAGAAAVEHQAHGR